MNLYLLNNLEFPTHECNDLIKIDQSARKSGNSFVITRQVHKYTMKIFAQNTLFADFSILSIMTLIMLIFNELQTRNLRNVCLNE